MGLTNAARNAITTGVITGTISTPWDNANSHIGVGDSSAVYANTQTDLQAATNKLRKAMVATWPQQATNVLTYKALFSFADANWVWNEWGVFNAASGGTMLNRKVEALGTKTSAEAWEVTSTLTFTAV